MAFSDLLCHMARSPALAVTVLLTLAVLVVNGWTDAPNAIAGVVVSGALPFPAGDIWAGKAGGGGRFWGMGGMRGWRGRLSYGWEREADHQGGGIVRLHGIIPAMRGVWLRRQWRPGGKDHPHGAGSRQRPGR